MIEKKDTHNFILKIFIEKLTKFYLTTRFQLEQTIR
jgi:hypothetical protein